MADDQVQQVDPSVFQKSKLMDELYQDPKTRDQVLGIIKTKYPDVRIPELEVQDRVEKIEQKWEKRYEEREKTWQEREAKAARLEAIEAMKAKGVQETEVEEVEKLMVEAKIGDPATAAEVFVTRRAAAAPRTRPDFTFDLPDQKELFGSPSQRKNWARKMAAQTLVDVRSGRGV